MEIQWIFLFAALRWLECLWATRGSSIGAFLIAYLRLTFKYAIIYLEIVDDHTNHLPPHFHAFYGGSEVLVSIDDLEVLEGTMAAKQRKMLLGWAAFHQEELRENWELAKAQQELFAIDPLR